ncbi:hypothetical protein N7463_010945 [Penicillium fimorum]|uniref:Uncharacterized protein n=1 Tax=Penicillium fimorum TaxID=1882269 RepID=A0A9X0C1R1_9EURO|nr:hypothetical protein N7463_010945 [Penicillium fimorum]
MSILREKREPLPWLHKEPEVLPFLGKQSKQALESYILSDTIIKHGTGYRTRSRAIYLSPCIYGRGCDARIGFQGNRPTIYSTRVELTWLDIAHKNQSAANALEWAFRSLGVLQLGRVDGNQRHILASQEMYSRALGQLVKAIKNPATVGKNETLGAAVLLGVYELMNATEENSWLLHASGISHLLRLRGAKRHASGYGRTLLLSFRGLLVYEAFTRGEACFLENEEWRSALSLTLKDEEQRGTSCGLGQLTDYAFNEIARCPGFLAKTKALVASPRTTNAERDNLMDAINISREILRDVEVQIMAGIKANHEGNKKVSQAFFGLIPLSAKDASVNYTLEGVQSAIALLRQLSVLLVSDRGRQETVTPWLKLGPCNNDQKVIKDTSEIAQLSQKSTRIHPTGPQQRGNPKIWHDRIAMTMGMPDNGLLNPSESIHLWP